MYNGDVMNTPFVFDYSKRLTLILLTLVSGTTKILYIFIPIPWVREKKKDFDLKSKFGIYP